MSSPDHSHLGGIFAMTGVTRTTPLPRNPGGKLLKRQLRDEVDWGQRGATLSR